MKKIIAFLLAVSMFTAMFTNYDARLWANNTKIDQELRGVWVATVLNIDYPKELSTDPDKLKLQAIKILDEVQALNMNAVFLQVRPTADSFYNSDIFGYSKYLTGYRGLAPDGKFDPLQFWVEEAHKRGIELHAWVNPYRITKNEENKEAETLDSLPLNHPAKLNPHYVVKHGKDLYFDPGMPEVRMLIIAGIEEILKKYDVDGIHFDDYFYPSSNFQDSHTHARYSEGKGLQQWRIENVNKLVQGVHEVSKKYNKTFGISPFGIWKNKKSDPIGSNTSGGETYYQHFADCRAWVKNGWIDYIMPQIYWEFGHSAADYKTLVDWWSDTVKGTNVKLYIGHAAYRSVKEAGKKWYGADELIKQVNYSRQKGNISGNVFFSYRSFLNNSLLSRGMREYYKTPAKPSENANNAPSVDNKKDDNNTNSNNTQNGNTPLLFDTPPSNPTPTPTPTPIPNDGSNPSKSIGRTLPTANDIMNPKSALNITSHKSGAEVKTSHITLEGTFDPTYALILNGKKITNTSYGNFRIPYTLNEGANHIAFTNGDSTKILLINNKSGSGQVNQYEPSNAYPSTTIMINSNEVNLSCKALTGARVVAHLAGQSYELSPDKAADLTKPNLQKISYSKTIDISGFGESDLGNVEYEISYSEKKYNIFSNGSIINLKNNSNYYAMVSQEEVDNYFKNDAKKGSAHMLDKGDIDRIIYMSGDYVKLSSGYWVKRGNISWFYSKNKINTNIAYQGFTETQDLKSINFTSSVQTGVFLKLEKNVIKLFVPLANSLPELPAFPDSFKLRKARAVNDELAYYEFQFDRLPDSFYIKKNAGGFEFKFMHHKVINDPKFPLRDLVIMIDPGHGGSDVGTEGHKPSVINEKMYTLSTSNKIKDHLEKLGATVYMTRYTDEDVYLYDRIRASKAVLPDLFMSVHANAVKASRAKAVKGFSIYIQQDNALELSRLIRNNMVNNLGMKDMKIIPEDFYVTRGTWGIHMLLEMGFLTHPEEFLNLSNPEFQEKQANEVAKAVVEYFSK